MDRSYGNKLKLCSESIKIKLPFDYNRVILTWTEYKDEITLLCSKDNFLSFYLGNNLCILFKDWIHSRNIRKHTFCLRIYPLSEMHRDKTHLPNLSIHYTRWSLEQCATAASFYLSPFPPDIVPRPRPSSTHNENRFFQGLICSAKQWNILQHIFSPFSLSIRRLSRNAEHDISRSGDVRWNKRACCVILYPRLCTLLPISPDENDSGSYFVCARLFIEGRDLPSVTIGFSAVSRGKYDCELPIC